MTVYDAYAPFYDGSGQIRFAVLMAQYVAEVLERHPTPGKRALDLACGTGTLALLLADRGWHVVGLDSSEPMLALARAKSAALDTSGSVRFVQGDMRRIPFQDGPGSAADSVDAAGFDLVTCTYDSVNYLLSEEDLARCFAGAARALCPGGVFIVDMNTRHFLEHDWGPCEVLESAGFVQILQSYFDPPTGQSTMLLTGFAGSDAYGYERFDEIHIERAYAPELVYGLLGRVGLQVEALYDCFTFQSPVERSQRLAWVVRKV